MAIGKQEQRQALAWPLPIQRFQRLKSVQACLPISPNSTGVRSASGEGDYITHGNSAIVHAADDVSVLQTLEGLSAILRSARAIGGSRPYRLGLVSIAMRSNPYGTGLQPNPRHEVRTMTDTDPRQATEFAATYAIAATALAAAVDAEAICLAAPGGPFSLQGPLERAVFLLAGLSGQDVQISEDARPVHHRG